MKPTIRSSTRRACWAFTRLRSMSLGCSMACRMAGLVISWNTMRLVCSGFRPSTSYKCHEIASPSRSSSEANQTVPAFLASAFSSFTSLVFSEGISYCGAKFVVSMLNSFFLSHGCARNWIILCSLLPKIFSMVLALAGDSTITKFFCMVCTFIKFRQQK